MMLTSMSVPLLGLVDTALLGHLDGARYLAAVAIGANVIGLLYWSFGFLRMGTTSLVAQSLGKTGSIGKTNAGRSPDPNREIDGIMFRAMLIAAALGLAITVFTPLLLDWIVQLMNASADAGALAAEYIRIRVFSAPAALVTYVISGWLVGTQRAKGALALVLTSNLVNIVLDAWFILELGMKSEGAALASVMAEYCSLGLGLFIAFRYTRIFNIRRWRGWLVLSDFYQTMRMNYHLLMRTLLLLFALNFFTAQGAALGDNILAANAILLQLALLSAYVMDGFSYAAEALCGESAGRKQVQSFHRYASICGGWILVAAMLFTVGYLFAGSYIVASFTDVSDIRLTAQPYLCWLVVMPLAGGLAYLLDGVFIGAGESQVMHLSMWFSVVVIFLPLWWLSQGWGNHGLWLAFVLFNLARGLSLAAYYPGLLKRLG